MAYAADKLKSIKAKSLTLLTYLSDFSVQCSVSLLLWCLRRRR